MKKIYDWIIEKIWGKRIRRYFDWGLYEMGYTGSGPTAFDVEPEFKKPWVPFFYRKNLDKVLEIESDFRRKSFGDSVIEVTGEDPNEWNTPWYK